jgi:hypothetical protein
MSGLIVCNRLNDTNDVNQTTMSSRHKTKINKEEMLPLCLCQFDFVLSLVLCTNTIPFIHRENQQPFGFAEEEEEEKGE